LKIAVLPGDGVGREVTAEAVQVLEQVGRRRALSLRFEEALVGGAAIDALDAPLPAASLALARGSDAVLLGAVGGPQWDGLPYEKRPERALLGLRKELELYCNLRPVKLFAALAERSSLRPEAIRGCDLLIVRELTGGIYFGEPRAFDRGPKGRRAVDTCVYHDWEVERVAALAFEAARKRRRLVHSVDKSNILKTSILWREVVEEVARRYPDVTLKHLLVDNCAMQIVRDPLQFDVILTENLFGDILSDEAAMLGGSIGLLPSASLGGKVGLYEPVHGSAPDIAGQGKANPLAMILSAAMMLRLSLGLAKEALAVESAVESVLAAGYRTADILPAGRHGAQEGTALLNTQRLGELVAATIGGEA
jgi:3-isopropylmalate dehydrogenase